MAPRRKGFWCPAMRLSAFFVGVALLGNLVFGAAYVPALEAHAATPSDYFDRKVERVRRSVRLVRERVKDAIVPEMADHHGFDPLFEVLDEPATFEEISWVETTPDPDPATYLILPESIDLGSLPILPRAEADFFPDAGRLADEEFYSMSLRSDFINAARPRRARGILIDLGNNLLGLPQGLIDGAVEAGRSLMPPEGNYSLRAEDDSSLMQRLLVLREGEDVPEPFVDALNRWIGREQNYFAGFAENPLYSFGVEDGNEDIDYSEFREDQRRILFDVLRKTYVSKYFAKVEDRVRDEAYKVNEWTGVDFLLGPPVIAAYTWIRGFERRMTIAGDLKLRVKLEPLRRIDGYRGELEEDYVSALGFELGFSDFPLKAIVSFGYHNGEPEMDFIGIGTSVGEAKKAVVMLLAEAEPPAELR